MNEGKKFEDNFKKSIPEDVYYLRLHDSSIGFDIQNSTQRFALKSPFDCILFARGEMYCLELKTTSSTSISFAGSGPMIKEHQVKELQKAHSYGCSAGFIVNFRKTQDTYYLPIDVFVTFKEFYTKKSFNISDLENMPCIYIPSKKLKTNYRYDIEPMLGG